MKNTDDNDINELFIEAVSTKRAHERKASTTTKKVTTIKVRGTLDVARDDYKRAKALHKARIRELRDSIKSHKIMLRQAKNTYKLAQLAHKK